jgi:hypothetical protein
VGPLVLATGMPIEYYLHPWPANSPIGRPTVEMLARWHTFNVNISQSVCQLFFNGSPLACQWCMVYMIGMPMVNGLYDWHASTGHVQLG